MVDRTSLRTIIYDAILIALTRRGFLYLDLPITPCALIFPSQQLGNLLSLCREIAGARDILQKIENLKKQHEWNFNL
jgi:hypothetical protein